VLVTRKSTQEIKNRKISVFPIKKHTSPKVRATAATHWTARVWYRHNQRWLQASKEGAEESKSGSFKDESDTDIPNLQAV